MQDTELVKEIIDKTDIVEYIGRYVDLKPKNNEYFGLCPFHNEDTPSFSVTPANKKYFCFGCGCGGTVITFTAKINKISYDSALNQMAKELNINRTAKIKSPTVAILRQLASDKSVKEVQHTVLSNSVMDQYVKANINPWIEEGIPQKIIDKYGVRIDAQSNRIVYPVYDNSGNLINVKGRTMYKDFKEMKIPKYINYYKVGDLDYLQGYYLKRYLIDSAGEIIIFEGIKSVMKADSFGYYNSVSCETHKLNIYQIRFLIGLRCDVVIAFDKDVDYNKTLRNLEMLKRFVNVYVIRDKDGLLEGKDSPVDQGKEVWERLYQNKIRI